MKITETHAQEHSENGSYIPQLFTKSSHLENPKCLKGVAYGLIYPRSWAKIPVLLERGGRTKLGGERSP